MVDGFRRQKKKKKIKIQKNLSSKTEKSARLQFYPKTYQISLHSDTDDKFITAMEKRIRKNPPFTENDFWKTLDIKVVERKYDNNEEVTRDELRALMPERINKIGEFLLSGERLGEIVDMRAVLK